MNGKVTRELVGKLLAEKTHNPPVKRWLKGLLGGEPPEVKPETLRTIGLLVGLLEYDPRRHPAVALAPWEERLLRALKLVMERSEERQVRWARKAWGRV